MESCTYVKVMLYAYPRLEMLAEASESAATAKALLSFREAFDPWRLAERVAEEMAQARLLRALKEETELLLAGLSEEERYLLEYKYFRRRQVLRERFGGFALDCTERSYFRRQNALLGKLAGRFAAFGWTRAAFFERFGGYAPFMRVYRALLDGREHALVLKRRKKTLSLLQTSASDGEGRLPRTTSTATRTTASAKAERSTICKGEREELSSAGGGGSSASPEEGRR